VRDCQEKNQNRLSQYQECDFCCVLGSWQVELSWKKKELTGTGRWGGQWYYRKNVEVTCNNEFMRHSGSNGKEGLNSSRNTEKDLEKDEDTEDIYNRI